VSVANARIMLPIWSHEKSFMVSSALCCSPSISRSPGSWPRSANPARVVTIWLRVKVWMSETAFFSRPSKSS